MEELDKILVKSKEDSATNVIEDGLSVYGSSVIRSKFPTEIDGCKDVVRNIIWSAEEYKKLTKFLRAVGDTMVIHHSGDQSIIDAMYRIGQPFMVGHPLLQTDGCAGMYHDVSEAAAPRYLNVMLSEFGRDLFYNGVVMKTIPQKPSSDYSEPIAQYFIPRLPVSLLIGNMTVGFAFKSDTPMVDIHDVCDLVVTYSDFYKKGGVGIPPYKSIAKYLIPGYPIPGIIKNRQSMLDAYSKGDFTVPMISEGTCDLNGNSMILRSIPYGIDFGRVTNKFRNTLIDKKSDVRDIVVSANQYSSDEAEFTIEFKKGHNPFRVHELLSKHLEYSNTDHFIFNYTRDGKIRSTNPALVVQRWYTSRYLSIAGGLKYKQSELIAKKIRIEAILIICDHTDEVIDLIKHSNGVTDAITRLHERYKDLNLSWNQADIIANQPLTRLSNVNKKLLTEELDKVIKDMATVLANFGKIHDVIRNDAMFFKKKYSTTKKTRYSDEYLGYVKFGELGIINFFTDDEIPDILSMKGWHADTVKTVHKYSSPPNSRYYVLNGRLYPISDPSKYMRCERIVELPSTRRAYTLCISADGVSVIDKEVTHTNGDYTLLPINDEFYAIYRDGSLRLTNVSDFTIRKGVTKGVKSKIVYGVPKSSKDMIVLHMSEGEPNVIRADRILKGDKLGVLKTGVKGKLHILGVYPIGTREIIVNVPKECTKAFLMQHLFIYHLGHLFSKTKSDHQIISITRSSGWSNSGNIKNKIVRSDVVKTMYTLDLSSLAPKEEANNVRNK